MDYTTILALYLSFNIIVGIVFFASLSLHDGTPIVELSMIKTDSLPFMLIQFVAFSSIAFFMGVILVVYFGIIMWIKETKEKKKENLDYIITTAIQYAEELSELSDEELIKDLVRNKKRYTINGVRIPPGKFLVNRSQDIKDLSNIGDL